MSDGNRAYISPKREAQVEATKDAILQAFADQLSEPGGELSPTDAAARAGVSVRTVHSYFPNRDVQIEEIGKWFDRRLFPHGFVVAQGPDDLPRYFRDIHTMALASPLTKALAYSAMSSPEIRQRRRQGRVDAIRQSIAEIGAPEQAAEDAAAVLLALSGADASWTLHDMYGLPLERIPDAVAHTVQLVVDDLKRQAPTTKKRS